MRCGSVEEGLEMNNMEIRENVASINWMHSAVMSLGNEDAEEIWFLTYPDGADEDDVLEMAKDEQIMEWLHGTFARIMHLVRLGLN